jgi:hypothetical protein
MSDKSAILTDTEQAVLQTMTMQMNPKPALEYLKGVGIDISKRTYFRCKKKVEATKWQRLYHIAELFTDQHLERIDKLQLVESLMWKNYYEEKNPSKKVQILYSIVQMQPFLSNYYGATRFVLEKRLKIDPIKKPDIYLDIDIYKKQIEENKYFSQRDYLNKQEQQLNKEQELNKQEKDSLRRMTLGKDLDRFNPEQ